MSAQLDFTLSLIDKITRPLRQAEAGVKGFASKTNQAFSNIAVGGAGLFGVGMGIKAVLQPAHEMNMALGEVRSLGTAENALNSLRDAAMNFSIAYGGSATDFVKSSYDIQSAISGLAGDDLAAFTNASNVLAKATKADAGTITSYMGTMYGIFTKDAAAMGNAKWVEDIAGKTAIAVKMFKTSGNEMAGAFTALGASATSSGAGVSEQFAILGQLQSTMSGSEAGTKYKSFLAGVGGAQKALGLAFTDASGKMKSTPQILDLIRGKYGDLSKVADSDLIKKAFGSDEAVAMIKLLINNTDTLKGNINAIGNTKGLDYAVNMAKNMVDPWERLTAYMDAIRIVIGATLLPTIYPLLNGVADTGKQFMRWQAIFPHITKAIGLMVMAMLSLGAAGSVANIAIGVHRFAMLGLKSVLGPVARLLGLNRLAMLAGNQATIIFSAGLKMVRGAILATSMAARMGAASFLMMAWPVALVVGAIAALVAAVYVFWQPIKAFVSGFISGFSEAFSALTPFAGMFDVIATAISPVWNGIKTLFGWFSNLLSPIQMSAGELNNVTSAGATCGRFVAEAIGLILSPIQLVITQFGHLFDAMGIIKQGWLDVIAVFNLASPIESFQKIGEVIGNVFSGLWDVIKASFADTYGWIVDKLNKLPGINIDMPNLVTPASHAGVPAAANAVSPVTVPALPAGVNVASPVAATALPPVVNVTSQVAAPALPAGLKAATPDTAAKLPAVEKTTPPALLAPDLLTGGKVQGVGSKGVLAGGAVTGGQTTIDQRKTWGSTTIQVQQLTTPQQMREYMEMQ